MSRVSGLGSNGVGEVLFWRGQTVEASFDIVLYEQTQELKNPSRVWEKSVPDTGTAGAKALRQASARFVWGTAQRTVQVR